MKIKTVRPILVRGVVGTDHDTTEQHARQLKAQGLLVDSPKLRPKAEQAEEGGETPIDRPKRGRQ